MSPNDSADGTGHSRRDVLRAGAGLLATATVTSAAGCTQLGGLTGGGGASAQVDRAPGESSSVSYVDVQSILDDEATKRLVNAYLGVASNSEYNDWPADYEAALERVREEASLDPTKLQRLVVFTDFEATVRGEGEPFFGTFVDADWTESEVVDALEENGESYTEEEYAGKTVYVSDSQYSDSRLAVLGDGHYVLGTKAAVEAAVDVESGDGESVGEELMGAFEATRDGSAVRFATEVPEDAIPSRFPVGGDSVELDAFQEVTHTGGALYSTGDQVGFELTLLCASETAAEDVREQTQALITVSKSLESTDEDAEAFLDAIEVSVEGGTNVVVSYEASVDELATRVEAFASDLYR